MPVHDYYTVCMLCKLCILYKEIHLEMKYIIFNIYICIERQTDKQTDRLSDRQIDRQTDSENEREGGPYT